MTFGTIVIACALGTLVGLLALSSLVLALGYGLKVYQRKKIQNLMKGK